MQREGGLRDRVMASLEKEDSVDEAVADDVKHLFNKLARRLRLCVYHVIPCALFLLCLFPWKSLKWAFWLRQTVSYLAYELCSEEQ